MCLQSLGDFEIVGQHRSSWTRRKNKNLGGRAPGPQPPGSGNNWMFVNTAKQPMPELPEPLRVRSTVSVGQTPFVNVHDDAQTYVAGDSCVSLQSH